MVTLSSWGDDLLEKIKASSVKWPTLPGYSKSVLDSAAMLANPCAEINAGDWRPRMSALSPRYSGKPANWMVFDERSSFCQIPEVEKEPLDPQELRNAIGRSLRGETQDAAPFRARIRSQKQLKQRYWRHVKRMLEAERERDDKAREKMKAKRELEHAQATNQMLRQEIECLWEKRHELEDQIKRLEAIKEPERGSW